MAVKMDLEAEQRKLEFKNIRAEIDKVANMQKLLIVGIRFSLTALQFLLVFGLFMALDYIMPVSTKVARYMLYSLIAFFVLEIIFYVIKPFFEKANDEELAVLIEKRYPQLLDRFICSVEMNKSEAAAVFSPELIKALWVDTDKVKKALKLDLRKALSLTKGRKYIGFAVGIMVVVFAASIVAPEFLLKSTTGVPLVNKFFTALLKGNSLQDDMKIQEKNIEEQLNVKEKNIEEMKNLLAGQKNLNKDLKEKINERKAAATGKPWLPTTGGVSGICTMDGKPAVDVYVAVKSTTDSKVPGVGAKSDGEGKWVVKGLSTSGSYQIWVMNLKLKSTPKSYFGGVVIEKDKIRDGYNFALSRKTPAKKTPGATIGNAVEDENTYQEQDPNAPKGPKKDDLFPKTDFDQLKDDKAKAEELEKQGIILPKDEKTEDLPDAKQQPQEKKLDEMAKELEQQKKEEQKDAAEKLKELSEKMEEMKKDESKKDENQKEQERKEMEKQLEDQAKKLQDTNKEISRELKKMSEEMKEEDNLKKKQEELTEKLEELQKKEQMKEVKDKTEEAKQEQEKAEKELQKSEMEKALEKALDAEKKLEEALKKMMEEQQKKEEEQVKKEENKEDQQKKKEMKELQEKLEEEAKKMEQDKSEEKKLDELLKQVEDQLKKMEEMDKKKAEELKKELEQAKKERNKGQVVKKLQELANLFGELKNRAFLDKKNYGTDEDTVENMSRDEVPSKYKKLLDKYRTSLSK